MFLLVIAVGVGEVKGVGGDQPDHGASGRYHAAGEGSSRASTGGSGEGRGCVSFRNVVGVVGEGKDCFRALALTWWECLGC